MAKKRKSKQGVNFDLEDDADDIFRSFVESEAIDLNEAEVAEELEQRRSRRRSQSKQPISVDLHGFAVEEAKAEIRRVVAASLVEGGALELKVITGKGRHSGPGGGVLIREVYDFIVKTYASQTLYIDPPPYRDLLEGVPLKGHFTVRLKDK